MSYYDQWMSDQKTRRKRDSSHLQKALIVALIFAIIGIVGWMTERDIAHHAEIARQMECEPGIEMTMPIEERVRA